MLIPGIKRTDPDKIFAIVHNDHATATLVHGYAVIWETSSPTHVGCSVITTTGGSSTLIAGVIHAGANGIAPMDFGMCQTYGYHAAVSAAAGITAGQQLSTHTTDGMVEDDADCEATESLGVALTNTASAAIAAHIRCM